MTSSYFVSVQDPKPLRRELLESSKLIIYSLKNYQHIKKIREEKLEYVKRLQAEFKELMILVDKLENLLPEQILKDAPFPLPRHEERKEEEEQKPIMTPDEEMPKPEMHEHELARLEHALSSVEDKLKVLDEK